MSDIAIVTDSTANIPDALVKKYGIYVAPQVLIWGDKTYQDGVDIQPDEFYTRLKNTTVMPTTSQVSIQTFEQLFKQLTDQGKQVLAILISNKLSGTIDSAIHAQRSLTNAPVEIIDSFTTAMSLGFIILEVARAIEKGANISECKALAENARHNTGVIFAVDTLEFLHRGGRIGGATRFLGTALQLKPILELQDGRVEAVERVRTRNKSLNRIVEMVEERIGSKTPIRLASLHANAPEEAKMVLELASTKLNPIEKMVTQVSPVVGTHAGPGTVGLAYFAGM